MTAGYAQIRFNGKIQTFKAMQGMTLAETYFIVTIVKWKQYCAWVDLFEGESDEWTTS